MGRRDSELKAIYDRIGSQFDLETYELGHRLFPENLRVLDLPTATHPSREKRADSKTGKCRILRLFCVTRTG